MAMHGPCRKLSNQPQPNRVIWQFGRRSSRLNHAGLGGLESAPSTWRDFCLGWPTGKDGEAVKCCLKSTKLRGAPSRDGQRRPSPNCRFHSIRGWRLGQSNLDCWSLNAALCDKNSQTTSRQGDEIEERKYGEIGLIRRNFLTFRPNATCQAISRRDSCKELRLAQIKFGLFSSGNGETAWIRSRRC
ncbi:hypothetical protein BJX65DRAFT_13010 [Aspergillus insuetus]